MIIACIKKIISFIKEHAKTFIEWCIGFGAVGATVGIFQGHQSKSLNKKALSIQERAIEEHDRELQKTMNVLEDLGAVEKEIIGSFIEFSDTMEKIEGRPEFKKDSIINVKLADVSIDKIKSLAVDVQLAVVGIGAAGAGMLAGLAAFGAEAVALGPAAVFGGAVICAKGFAIKKKSVTNLKQARATEKSVREIISYYKKIESISKIQQETLFNLWEKYKEYLEYINNTINEKQKWKEFSKTEKDNVKIEIRIVKLLYNMCTTPIIIKQKEENEIEKVNSNEVVKFQKEAEKLLSKI